MRILQLVFFFWALDAALGATGQNRCQLGFEEFTKLNSPTSGIVVKQVKDWYNHKDVESIKSAYPQPKTERHGKIVVFSSDPEEQKGTYFRIHPEYLNIYQSQAALRNIAEKMRQEILESLPEAERKTWERKKYSVATQWSDGTEPLVYDHVQHVHRDQVVATLTLEGNGTIVKLIQKDISKMDYRQIYDEADGYPGHTYQAADGELVLINGVHNPGGGLHAAPQSNGTSPSRLTVLVSIHE